MTDNRPYRPNVGIMLLNKNKSKVWVGSRIDYPNTPTQEYWQMPQGGVDEGEYIEKAMWRELQEETSISQKHAEIIDYHKDWIKYDLPNDLSSKLWNGQFKGQKQKWFLLKLTSEDSSININTENPEFSDWKWTDIESLAKNIVPFKKEIYQQVIKDFDKHLI
ncbi:MAG: RNA pyrophosphohydrolase [Alphaproteobacteria bacterium]|nr:RNA pyrophosphohydrolase [Alphaproteobacteria bacterium]